MITDTQEREILTRAYVPEHIVGLMTRVSGGEPFLIDDFFCCVTRNLVIVVGYPLEHSFRVDDLDSVFDNVIDLFHPAYVSIAAPELPSSISASCRERESDYYYTLDLQALPIRSQAQKAAMKALQHAVVERANRLGDAHYEVAEEFVARVNPAPRVRELLFRMWDYVGRSRGSRVLSAWTSRDRLAAFYVVDLSARDFSTYVIGCHSKMNYVQGASDLLFSEMIQVSKEQDKKYIHLGLGVNEGIRRFKTKWGGRQGLRYEMCEVAVRKPSLFDAIITSMTGK